MKKIFFTLICLGLTACQIPTKLPIHNMQNQFDIKQAETLMKKGKNTIIGNSFLRQRGGQIVTCAGYQVELIPATTYAEERMFYLYTNTENGINNSSAYEFIPDSSEYYKLQRETICDSSGHFKFDNIADGTFFIITRVMWEIPRGHFIQQNGGYLLKKVTVKNGETKEIIITN